MSDNQARLIRAFEEKEARKKAEQVALKGKLLAEDLPQLTQHAIDAGAVTDEEKRLTVENLASSLAKEKLGLAHAGDFSQQALDHATAAIALAHEAKNDELLAEMVRQQAAKEQVDQKGRMNTGDMDRLAELGPSQPNYSLLKADPERAKTEEAGSSQKDDGLLSDFVTADTKRADEERRAALQREFQATAMDMTR